MIKMPRNVVRFERLMYLYLAIAIAAVLLYPSADTQRHFARSATVTIVAFVAVTGLYVLGIWSVARWRKNWVRWAGVIGFIIGLPFGLKEAVENYRANPGGNIAVVVEDVLQGLAFCFVFSGDARPWFREDREIHPGTLS
jgi:ABC-type proline/glycine betaine transport system permease subunit